MVQILNERKLISQEIKDLLIADVVLTLAFSLILSGGISNIQSNIMPFVLTIPIAFIAVTLSFILHEYMHKIVAQKFGAIAAFRRSDTGIVITLITSLFGFLLGLPGATMIYTNTFTKKEEGYVSLAGPLTNFAIFALIFAIFLFLPAGTSSYITGGITTILFINLWLAFVNMLPIYPLDGSKVLRWNKPVYAVTMGIIFILLWFIVGVSILPSIGFVLIFAIVLSFFYKSILFN